MNATARMLLTELDELGDEVRGCFDEPFCQEARWAAARAENEFLGALASMLAGHRDGPDVWARALEATRANELVR